MKYSDGSPISLGDRVKLENGEIATVVMLFLDDELVLGHNPEVLPTQEPGVMVLTERGARVSYVKPDDRDFTKICE